MINRPHRRLPHEGLDWIDDARHVLRGFRVSHLTAEFVLLDEGFDNIRMEGYIERRDNPAARMLCWKKGHELPCHLGLQKFIRRAIQYYYYDHARLT